MPLRTRNTVRDFIRVLNEYPGDTPVFLPVDAADGDQNVRAIPQSTGAGILLVGPWMSDPGIQKGIEVVIPLKSHDSSLIAEQRSHHADWLLAMGLKRGEDFDVVEDLLHAVFNYEFLYDDIAVLFKLRFQ